MVVRTDELVRTAVGRSMLRGVVVGFVENGLVELSAGGDRYRCEMLDSAESGADPLRPEDIVLFVPPDEEMPYGCILGRIRRRQVDPELPDASSAKEPQIIESKDIEIQAGSSLVLKCGKGSISIKNDGTIIVKGSRLLSRSSGVNKIKGAAVQIN